MSNSNGFSQNLNKTNTFLSALSVQSARDKKSREESLIPINGTQNLSALPKTYPFHFFNRNNISIFAANYSHAKLFRIQFQDFSIATLERDINGRAY